MNALIASFSDPHRNSAAIPGAVGLLTGLRAISKPEGTCEYGYPSALDSPVTPSPPEGWQWDETLYRGSAPYYVRGRPPYAPGLADALRRTLALDGQGRLLDVGCGPGIVTLPLAQLFTEVVGLDPDPGMLAEGARRAAEAGVENIVWVRARAEDLPAGLGRFRVATFAQSLIVIAWRRSSLRCSSRAALWSTSATSRETGHEIAPTTSPLIRRRHIKRCAS
ncbi:MAG: class SAM-dependent methyltransferase [Thermomicrobiales bacterium]|nr:class SAM-dependent methyltransferase [Thermomicrobiales bacterium]